MRSERRTLALLALVLAAGCGEPTADVDQPAYSPTYETDGRSVLYHWRAGNTIHLYAQPTSVSNPITLRAALQTAIESWRIVPEFREYRLELVDDVVDADVIVRFRDDAPLVAFADCAYPDGRASGITFFCPDVSLTRAQTLTLRSGTDQGHVRMDVALDAASANFQSVVTHEIGHVLGIGAHSLERTDLMYPFPIVTTPSARDIATLRYVLHEPSALVL